MFRTQMFRTQMFRTQMFRTLLCGLTGTALLAGCGTEEPYDPGPMRVAGFEVGFPEGSVQAGTPMAPLPFPSATPAVKTITVKALGRDGLPFTAYNRTARVRVVPGEIIGNDRIEFIDGEAQLTVEFRFSYDETFVWVEDVGEDPLHDCADGLDNDDDGLVDNDDPDCFALLAAPAQTHCTDGLDNDGDGLIDDADPGCHVIAEHPAEDAEPNCADGLDNDRDGLPDGRDPQCMSDAEKALLSASAKSTGATGISPPLHFARPAIRDLQFSPRCTTDTPLGGHNVTIDTGLTDERPYRPKLVVTGTTQSGMYVTDLQGFDENGVNPGYNSVYLFTFSNPGDVRRGDRLCSIAGNAAEFIGNTQLNFPSFVNADFNRDGVIDERDNVPCALVDPEDIGPEAVPEPTLLLAKSLDPEAEYEDGEVQPDIPEGFYLSCNIDGSVIEDLVGTDGRDCNAARRALGDDARDSAVDCRRDNFSMEPFEHSLVAFENMVVSTSFQICDFNGDGSTDWGGAEGDCNNDCGDDPLCSVLRDVELYGQFSGGVGCTDYALSEVCDPALAVGSDNPNPDAEGPCGPMAACQRTNLSEYYQAGGLAALPDEGEEPVEPVELMGRCVPKCEGGVHISTRDTMGGAGYEPRDNPGAKYARIVGHLRQLQPGPGIPTDWVVEPRFIEDFETEVAEQ